MTLRHLRIFIAVYEQKNITCAANQLYMTQPAVSRAIGEIESKYGLQLFIRLRNGVSPTETGTWFYKQAQHIIYSFDKMESEASNFSSSSLNIDCCAMLGESYMPSCVSRFNKLYPQLSLKVTISKSSEHILIALQRKEIDMAIVETEINSNDFLMKKLFDYHLVPIFPLLHPLIEKNHLSLEEMESCGFICTEKGRPLRTYVEKVFSAHGMQFTPQWVCISTQGIINAVSLGHGISFLPHWSIKSALQNGLVATRSIDNEELLRNVYVVYPKEHLGNCGKTFLEFILSDSVEDATHRFM